MLRLFVLLLAAITLPACPGITFGDLPPSAPSAHQEPEQQPWWEPLAPVTSPYADWPPSPTQPQGAPILYGCPDEEAFATLLVQSQPPAEQAALAADVRSVTQLVHSCTAQVALLNALNLQTAAQRSAILADMQAIMRDLGMFEANHFASGLYILDPDKAPKALRALKHFAEHHRVSFGRIVGETFLPLSPMLLPDIQEFPALGFNRFAELLRDVAPEHERPLLDSVSTMRSAYQATASERDALLVWLLHAPGADRPALAHALAELATDYRARVSVVLPNLRTAPIERCAQIISSLQSIRSLSNQDLPGVCRALIQVSSSAGCDAVRLLGTLWPSYTAPDVPEIITLLATVPANARDQLVEQVRPVSFTDKVAVMRVLVGAPPGEWASTMAQAARLHFASDRLAPAVQQLLRIPGLQREAFVTLAVRRNIRDEAALGTLVDHVVRDGLARVAAQPPAHRPATDDDDVEQIWHDFDQRWPAPPAAPAFNRENVMSADRNRVARHNIRVLYRLYPDVHAQFNSVAAIAREIERVRAATPRTNSAWTPRGGADEFSNALHALSGPSWRQDFPSFATNEGYFGEDGLVGTLDVLVKVWAAAERYPANARDAHESPEQVARSRANAQWAVIKAMAQVIEDDGHRTCSIGKMVRISSALAGYINGLEPCDGDQVPGVQLLNVEIAAFRAALRREAAQAGNPLPDDAQDPSPYDESEVPWERLCTLLDAMVRTGAGLHEPQREDFLRHLREFVNSLQRDDVTAYLLEHPRYPHAP